MRHVDIVPDWITAILAACVVAGAFSMFGGIGVLVLGILAVTIWVAQIVES
jgi:hypothetical protein